MTSLPAFISIPPIPPAESVCTGDRLIPRHTGGFDGGVASVSMMREGVSRLSTEQGDAKELQYMY